MKKGFEELRLRGSEPFVIIREICGLKLAV